MSGGIVSPETTHPLTLPEVTGVANNRRLMVAGESISLPSPTTDVSVGLEYLSWRK